MMNTNSSTRDRFRELRENLRSVFKERENAIDCLFLAALSGHHALLVGPPGTAKSALVTAVLSAFPDARLFQTLLTKFGTEDELFGPVKLSALKADKWERNLDGRLAGVDVAFLDEVFKGSDSVLNALLSALNERLYKGSPIPLKLVIGASNELPEEEVLAAVYDRFLLRDVVQYIEADACWMKLLHSPPSFTAGVQITLGEWETAVAQVEQIALPDRVLLELVRIKTDLRAAGITASDRRWVQLTRVLRAAAWLDDCSEVELDHLDVLRFGLWTRPDDRVRVAAALSTIDRSVVSKAVDIVDDALRAFARRPTEPAAYMEALPKLAAEVTDAAKRVQQHLNGGVSRRAHARIKPRLDELRHAHDVLKADLARRYAL